MRFTLHILSVAFMALFIVSIYQDATDFVEGVRFVSLTMVISATLTQAYYWITGD